MSGQKLSNGTLSLRFMQNSQRAQKLKHVELTKADVKDSEEWSIPNLPTAVPAPQGVICEPSYLPFLESTANGRRLFQKGAQVTNEPPPIPVEAETESSSVLSPKIEDPTPTAKGFVKPAGIDEPARQNKRQKDQVSAPRKKRKSDT